MVRKRTKSIVDETLPQYYVSGLFEVMNQFDESVVIFDDSWRYLFINNKGWELIDMAEEKVIGKNIWQLFPRLKGTQFERSAKIAMGTQEVAEIEEYYPHRQMWGRTKFYPSEKIIMVKIDDITELMKEKCVNEQLLGDLQPAMEIYWSERNRVRREGKPPLIKEQD
jgi:PAS domain-containing protein